MATPPKKAGADFDLDEDLFDFDQIQTDGDAEIEDEDLDLDEIFAAFQEAEDAAEEEATVDSTVAPEPSLVVEEAPAVAPREADPQEQVRGPEPAAIPAAHNAEPAATPVLVSGALGKGIVMVLVAMTLLNVMIALHTFKSTGQMRADLNDASRAMSATAVDIRADVHQQAQAVSSSFMPVVPPDPEKHPTFDRALADIETGNFAKARERIYALLAVVDRLPAESRNEVEARAGFLLAKSLHAEALSRESSR